MNAISTPDLSALSWYSDCEGMLYTRIPYNGRLGGQWQNGFSMFFDAHKECGGKEARNTLGLRVHACLSAMTGISDPSSALTKAREALRVSQNMLIRLGASTAPFESYERQALMALCEALKALGGE